MTPDSVWFSMLRNRVGFTRNAEYLATIREHACIACGAPGPSDPHHVFGSFVSRKTSDFATIPLCRPCHDRTEREKAFREECMVWLVLILLETVDQSHKEEV